MILMNKRKDDLTIRMMTSSRGAMVKPSFKGFRASYTQLPCLVDTQIPLPPPPPPPSSPLSISNQISNIQSATKSIVVEKSASIPKKTSIINVQNEQIYCDQTFDDKMFEIKSPGYPYRYFDHLDCSYLIRKNSANVCRLKVTFTYFNVVGEDGNCRGDYLDIFNTRFCGVLDQHTSKEIPFLQEKLLLHFHSNQQQTANGFHLQLEQVDCIPGRPAIPHQKSNINDDVSKSSDHSGVISSKTNLKKLIKSSNRKPSTTTITKSPFLYDDDEIISEFNTRNRATVMESHVIYEDLDNNNPTNPERFPIQQQHEEQRKKYPVRYYSPNITVVNEDKDVQKKLMDNNDYSMMIKTTTTIRPSQQRHDDDDDYITITTAPMIQPKQQQQYDRQSTKTSNKLCEQTFVDKIYFELKSTDLQMNDGGAMCHLHIRKAKTNVCQLDIMFMKYNLNDSSCNHQYLSVDGEKICGKIHETTTKRFWFQRSEIYLFVNLMDIDDDHIDDNKFEIKFRQVECATNNVVDHHHISRPISNENSDGNQFPIKGQQQQSMKTNPFIKQQQQHVNGDIVEQIDEQQQQQQQQLSDHYYNGNNKQNEWKMHQTDDHHMTVKPFRTILKQQQQHNPINENSNRMEKNQQKSLPSPTTSSSSSFNPYCDLIENDMNFHIENPNDWNFNTIERCRYTIRKANNNVCALDMKFQLFHLNEAIKCEDEYLEIDSSRICGAFPVGHERRYHFMPNEYEKVIYFISSKSSSMNRGKFRINVEQIDNDCDRPLPTLKPTLTMPTVCDISVGNYRGHIKSPNYPASYGDYTKCVYRIQAIGQEYCNVKLKIQDLDIESSSSTDNSRIQCEKDWLQISDTKKLCGNKFEQNEFIIPFDMHNGHKIALIKFTSDAFGNGRGFDIEYKQELCDVSDKHQRTSNLISPVGKKGGGGGSGGGGERGSSSLFRPPQIKLVKGDPYSSSSSSGSSSIRPQYPPNYVSKAHMLKTMDRKEFIKMMLMAEQEKMKMKINNKDAKESSLTTTTTMSSMDIDDNLPTTMNSVPENTIIFTTTISTEDSTENSNTIITTEPSVTTTMTTDVTL